jgi:hypothetical protein
MTPKADFRIEAELIEGGGTRRKTVAHCMLRAAGRATSSTPSGQAASFDGIDTIETGVNY